jgi:hypothetical protein
MKLDIGCGERTPEGWTGMDISPSVSPAIVADARKSWPIENETVTEARCIHFFEHLGSVDRCHVMRELWRVLVPGATVEFVTPLGFNRMAQDPDHKWPPVVRGTFYYYSRKWREANGLSHYERLFGLHFDFDIVSFDVKYDPDQYKTACGNGDAAAPVLGLLLMADPDAQTDLRTVLRKGGA